MSDPARPVNHDVTFTSFPITWRTSVPEILYALSIMGYGSHRELDRAWAILATKKNPEGRYILDWTPSQALFKPGKRGAPNKWITLYALLALKAMTHGK